MKSMAKTVKRKQVKGMDQNGKEVVKNDIFEMKIEDITAEGEGIGRVNGYALFVKDAVTEDIVRVKVIKTKKNYGYGKIEEIIKPSPYRVTPKCNLAKQCGGCQLQQLSYEQQLIYKKEKIKGCLTRIGKFENIIEIDKADSNIRNRNMEEGQEAEIFKNGSENVIYMEPIMGMEEPFYYRNKAQFPVGQDKEGNLVMGFYAGRSHNIIDTTHCAIQHPVNEIILQKIRKFLTENQIPPYNEEKHSGLVRHILTRVGYVTKEIMVCMIINGKSLPKAEQLIESLKEIEGMTSISLNFNCEKTNVILGKEGKTIWGKDTITDYIGSVGFQISPLSFYQVNPVQTKKLYETALEYADLQGNEIVWDLYCGIGTISLFLAQKAKQVYGVEIIAKAIDDAKKNAEFNHITNAEFFVGAAEEVLPQKYQESQGNMAADVIVVDPPRKGCDTALLDTIIKMTPQKVVYVSCDPATLARDLRYLCDREYQVRKVRGCDMFGQGVHVETCVLLSHKKADSHIEVKMDYSTDKSDNMKTPQKATYKAIQDCIENKYGFKVHTAYIAEVKRDLGLPMYDAPNAVDELKDPQRHPTQEKIDAIKDALKHFGII